MMRLKLNDGDGEGMAYVIHRTTKKDGFEADSEIVFIKLPRLVEAVDFQKEVH